MAKGKKEKKKGKKAPPSSKEVGGVRLPKPLRKAGKAALKAAQNPAVSETVAAALLAAAAALRDGDSVRGGAKAAGVAATDAADQATKDLTGLAGTLRALAIDFARKTLDSWSAEEDPVAARAEARPRERESAGKGTAAPAGERRRKSKASAPTARKPRVPAG